MATTLTVSEFKTLYPAFESIDDEIIQYHLDCVEETVSETVFCGCYKNAAYALLAHNLTLYQRGGGASGPVTAESVGSLSRSYGTTSSGDQSQLATTSYGQSYLRLVRIFASGGQNIC